VGWVNNYISEAYLGDNDLIVMLMMIMMMTDGCDHADNDIVE
jgi:hypothetical protein